MEKAPTLLVSAWLLVALAAGCRKDACLSASAQAQIDVTLGGLSPGAVATTEVTLTINGGKPLTRAFDRPPPFSFVFDLQKEDRSPRTLRVDVLARGTAAKVVGTGTTSTSFSADGCNFLEVTVEPGAADGGPDAPPDGSVTPDAAHDGPISLDALHDGPITGDAAVFAKPGSSTYLVPPGCSSAVVKAWGAGGGGGREVSAAGGGGGFASATVTVTGGATLTVHVGGGGGGGGASPGGGGFGGGGDTGTNPTALPCYGGGGGGASWVSDGATPLIVAGGGGGGSGEAKAGFGGGGAKGNGDYQNVGGEGGHQAGGGTGGYAAKCQCGAGTSGATGASFQGGGGGSNGHCTGGGGGGGYYGGGGGASCGCMSTGGGGGGGGYLHPSTSKGTLVMAQGLLAAQDSDPDYANGAGRGSNGVGEGNGTAPPGSPGRVVIHAQCAPVPDLGPPPDLQLPDGGISDGPNVDALQADSTSCGNGKIDVPAEDCDGTVFPAGKSTCEDFNRNGGNLLCTACTFDLSLCCVAPVPPAGGPVFDVIVSSTVGDDATFAPKCKPFKTITAALQSGATAIYVAPGTYSAGEKFPIALQSASIWGDTQSRGMGATPTVIDGSGPSTLVAGEATLEATGNNDIAGIQFKGGASSAAQGIVFVNNGNPAWGASVRLSTFSTDTGVYVAGGACVDVQSNTFQTSTVGVRFECGSRSVSDNTFTGGTGVRVLATGTGVTVNNNTFSGGTVGIDVTGGAPAIKDNSFAGLQANAAVTCSGTSSPTLRGNVFTVGVAPKRAISIVGSAVPDLGTTTDLGKNSFMGAALEHAGSMTVSAIGNDWPGVPACGTGIVISGTGAVVWGTSGQQCP